MSAGQATAGSAAASVKNYCEVSTRGYGFGCGQDAVAFVAYFSDGSGGTSACGKHIAKAVEDVLVAANATSGHARVVPVGKMRSRVMRSVRRRQIGEANGDA